jgi:hypothetical protein
MPIPHADSARVPLEKLTEYLLNEQHPVGGSKAKWFRSLGYQADHPVTLERDLCELVRTSEVYTENDTPFGTKYVVSGRMKSPSGKEVNLTTVWIIEPSDRSPRLVTAYPGEKT